MNSALLNFLLLLLLCSACAQLGTPTGGPKDVQEPEVVQIFPPNQSVNFTGKRIEITFNEYLKLNNLKQNLLISPPIKEQPEVSLSGKTLSIRWKEDLKPNTTYVFSFGNSITDMTEGNAISDFKYIFSTGAFLDSLQVQGRVLNAFSKQAAEEHLVLMYRLNDLEQEMWDSLPALRLPDYFTRTDKEGNYHITNIRDGSYKIIALEDGNANYRYDLPSEAIAFLNENIIPTDSTMVPVLLSFIPRQEHKFLKARSVLAGQVDFTFTNHAHWARIELLSPTFKTDVFHTLVVSDDTLRWFFDFGEVDSLLFLVSDALSPLGQSYADSVVVKPRKTTKAEPLKLKHNVQGEFLDLGDSLVLSFNVPLFSVDNTQITLVRNGKDTIPVVSQSHLSRPNMVVVPFEFHYQSSYVMYMAQGAFTDVLGQVYPEDSIRFKTRQETDYGSLILTFDEPQYNTIVVLLNEKKEIVRQLYSAGEHRIQWDNLTGGERRVQIIEDANSNQIWDSGHYWKKIQPEKVLYYPEKIQIRPNWEIEINFNQKPEEEK